MNKERTEKREQGRTEEAWEQRRKRVRQRHKTEGNLRGENTREEENQK
jgi:hypothetical protein